MRASFTQANQLAAFTMESIITEGDQFYATALRMIRSARESIFLNMYIFEDDEIGRLFQRALIRKARQGLQVHVIYDAIGSSAAGDEFWDRLNAAGVLALPHLPIRRGRLPAGHAPQTGFWTWLRLVFLRRNHRKILICDESAALIGGFNILRECSRKYYGPGRWLDLMYRTEVPAVVGELLRLHLDSMLRAHSPRMNLRSLKYKRVREAILYPYAARGRMSRWSALAPGWAQDFLPTTGARIVSMGIARALKQRLRRAKQRIYLVFPYFIPYGGFLRILARKAKEGVDVRIYISGVSDTTWIQEITVHQARKLYDQAIPVYLYHGRETADAPPRFNHTKAVLIDSWAGTGSSNFDSRSFQLNLETFVLRHRPPFLARFEDFIRGLEDYSDAGNESNLNSGWRARLLYPFRRFL